jgi:glutamate-1-semialdehyde 2,1-aminomutase
MFDPRNGILSHAGTFNNNVVTMAAGCAGIDIYNKNAVKRLNALGESFKSGLEAILTKHSIKKQVNKLPCPQKNELESPFTGTQSERPSNGTTVESLSLEERSSMWISGKGSMLCIHFSGESEKSLLALFWHHMLDHRIYLAPRGFIALNMELKEEHISKFLEAVEKFVEKYQQALVG